MPGVARLDRTQAAAYFMLGETTGTSAGGQDEEGKFLRVPGTNPFFPRDMADMGNRMLGLLDSKPLQVFVLNTGRVGGTDEATSKKVTIPCSSAMVEAIVSGTIEWAGDPDFGYEIAATIPGIPDQEILQPRRLYERQGRQPSTRPRWRASSRSGAITWPRSPAWTPRSSRASASRTPPRGCSRALRAAVFGRTDVSVPLWGNYVALMDRSCP